MARAVTVASIGVLTVSAIAALCAGCASSRESADPPSGVIVASGDGVAGYQHGADRTRFQVGGHGRRLIEHGYSKLSGDAGTFAIDQANGSTYGVPKASAPSLRLGPYGGAPAEHDALVRDYFARNGIAAEQIGGSQGRTLLEVTGRSDEKERPAPKVAGYYTVLQRAVEGIPIVDSFAWARVNAEGQIVEEAAYWPAISGDVVASVRKLRDVWSNDDQRRAFASRVNADPSKARLVIRHSSASSRERFESFASIDVLVESSADTATSFVRHFDGAGRELYLPQERFRLVQHGAPQRKPAAPGDTDKASAPAVSR